jgi:hypothetical protein
MTAGAGGMADSDYADAKATISRGGSSLIPSGLNRLFITASCIASDYMTVDKSAKLKRTLSGYFSDLKQVCVGNM